MRNVRGGFTLLEIVLAISLTAGVMAILYGVVASTVTAQRQIEAEVTASEIGPMLLTQIRGDLEAVFIPPDAAEQTEYFVGVQRSGGTGSWDRIDFLGSVMAYGVDEEAYRQEPAFHSINEIGYQVRSNPQESGVGILYRRQEYFLDEEPMQGGRLTELYDRVLSFDLKYYDGQEWVEEWRTLEKENRALPEAIQVELTVLVRIDENRDVERTYKLVVTRLD